MDRTEIVYHVADSSSRDGLAGCCSLSGAVGQTVQAAMFAGDHYSEADRPSERTCLRNSIEDRAWADEHESRSFTIEL